MAKEKAKGEKEKGPGRGVLAMNALGDSWLAMIRDSHNKETDKQTTGRIEDGGLLEFVDAFAAWKAFTKWLADEIFTDSLTTEYGKVIPSPAQQETYRRTLPLFEVFQPWFYWKRRDQQAARLAYSDRRLGDAMEVKKKNPDRPIGDIIRGQTQDGGSP